MPTADDPKRPDEELTDIIQNSGPVVDSLTVSLSNEVVHLLSEQLYTSPLKAIEELVVNAYDADAKECRIALLFTAENTPADTETLALTDEDTGSDEENFTASEEGSPTGLVAIYDDGIGMNVDGLRELWKIGDSNKSKLSTQVTNLGRAIIGKFGIGKLATYAIANRITYLTLRESKAHLVRCDFREFRSGSTGASTPVNLQVHLITNLTSLFARTDFKKIFQELGLEPSAITAKTSWTICILDNLKEKARELKVGRLSWVLRTAMPLKIDFRVFLNSQPQESSKENIARPINFTVQEFDESRLQQFNEKNRTNFVKTMTGLLEKNYFPNEIRGSVFVAEKSLVGKADLLFGRSNGYFVRVRGRLVNVEDKLFHNTALSFATFNRFRADLDIDDLHDEVTAPREGVEFGRKRLIASALARELFNQARDRYQQWLDKEEEQGLTPEHERVYVAPRLVEKPVADALAMYGVEGSGVEADKGWFYMDPAHDVPLSKIVEQLYSSRTRYQFNYSGLGESERLAKFDPATSIFTVNTDHELVRAFADDPRGRELIDLMTAAEVMLEVYMKESGIEALSIAEVLERRDMLLRSLAQDRVYSLESIATALRDNRDNSHELEMALVAAARALGFNAKHISGSSEPDGVARYLDSSMAETTITLEAKASQGVPSLSQLDLAGVKRHRDQYKAAGILLVAPTYPGESDPNSALSVSARADNISCWTVEQLARVVESAEKQQLTAKQIAGILKKHFAPLEVKKAIENLLSDEIDMNGLYKAVMRVLRSMFAERKLAGDQRKVSQIAGILSFENDFRNVTEPQVRKALVDLAHASRGAMSLSDDVIIFFTDLEEITRRVSSLTGEIGSPRSLGTFKA